MEPVSIVSSTAIGRQGQGSHQNVLVMLHEPRDRAAFTAKGKQSFSFFNAAKNLVGGLISPITTLFTHPVTSGLFILGGLAVGALVPAAIPMIALGVGAFSAYQVARGTINVVTRYGKGDKTGAENAFRDIGAGVTGSLFAFPALLRMGSQVAKNVGAIQAETAGAARMAEKAQGIAQGAWEMVANSPIKNIQLWFTNHFRSLAEVPKLIQNNWAMFTTEKGQAVLSSQLLRRSSGAVAEAQRGTTVSFAPLSTTSVIGGDRS